MGRKLFEKFVEKSCKVAKSGSSPEEHQDSHEESLEVAVSVDVCVVINGHFPKRLGGETCAR